MKSWIAALAFSLFATTASAGAWGSGSFENDDAMDWVNECVEGRGAAQVATALQAALKGNSIDATAGSVALAAAEVVAAARGKASVQLPVDLRQWLDRQPKKDIAALSVSASKAVERIKLNDGSELRQLWLSARDKSWERSLADLESRLR